MHKPNVSAQKISRASTKAKYSQTCRDCVQIKKCMSGGNAIRDVVVSSCEDIAFRQLLRTFYGNLWNRFPIREK
jgi:hypothetical protein